MHDNTKNTKIDTNKIRNIGIEFSENHKYKKKWLVEDTRQMNFFIGPNNSGKSRKIREVLITLLNHNPPSETWALDHEYLPLGELRNRYWDLESTVLNRIKKLSDFQLAEAFKEEIRKALFKNPLPITRAYKIIEDCLDEAIVHRESLHTSAHEILENLENYNSKKHLPEILKILCPNTSENPLETIKRQTITSNWKLTYIPTLRSLRHVSNDDAYLARTQKDYFPDLANLEENSGNLTIFTGHSLYKDLQAHLLGSHEKRERIRKYEKYLSENFFFGDTVTLVPMVDRDVVYIKQGDEEDRPIYNLGDGIQSIILLTYPVFMAENPTLFFIEEPEHFLHAGLQRTLVETFARHKEHMFFMTTHSNHFLDIAQERDDISIQQVSRQKIEQGKDQQTLSYETRVKPVSDYSYVLNELGVRASSVLLANCSIWVEGVTDKLYLRAYLRKYIDELKDEAIVKNCSNTQARAARLSSYHENLHFIFTEYQGSNITHWNFGNPDDSCDNNSYDNPDNNNHTRNQPQNEHEPQTPARKLNSKILLVADGDIAGKSDRVANLKKQLGIKCEVLKYKEIENYLPLNILIKTAEARWAKFNLTKGCNIKRFKNITSEKIQSEKDGVGTILERYIDKDNKAQNSEKKFFKAPSGTIKDKVKFCNTAIQIMNEEEWELTPELNELCDKIWTHIEQSNGNSR